MEHPKPNDGADEAGGPTLPPPAPAGARGAAYRPGMWDSMPARSSLGRSDAGTVTPWTVPASYGGQSATSGTRRLGAGVMRSRAGARGRDVESAEAGVTHD